MEPEDSALEKESDSQPNTFSSTVLQHDPDQINIGDQSTELISISVVYSRFQLQYLMSCSEHFG